ncbi:MAG: response regulator transcription factor [Syntrophorhabdaceae bacterium]|nr:response regulator transcription factor [Syntrophorhabdaceae bacterium]
MIKIILVEDQTLLRDALTKIINGQEDMTVVGFTDNADEAPDLCRKHAPDLALIDVVTAGKANGIAAASQIRRKLPEIKIVIMTALPEITFMEASRKAGAHSFVYKDSDSQHLLFVIRGTMKGKGTYPGPDDEASVKGRFSDVEIKVIRLVCRGKKRNEIVETLAMSESSVKAVISSILDKTGFDSITQFSMYAIARGLIVPDID